MEELAAGPSRWVLSPDQGFTKETRGQAVVLGSPVPLNRAGQPGHPAGREGLQGWAQTHLIQAFLGNNRGDSPGGPVAKTPRPQCRGPGESWSGGPDPTCRN